MDEEKWVLVERYVKNYPNDFRLVFNRGNEVIDITVPEEAWRAFDNIQTDPPKVPS